MRSFCDYPRSIWSRCRDSGFVNFSQSSGYYARDFNNDTHNTASGIYLTLVVVDDFFFFVDDDVNAHIKDPTAATALVIKIPAPSESVKSFALPKTIGPTRKTISAAVFGSVSDSPWPPFGAISCANAFKAGLHAAHPTPQTATPRRSVSKSSAPEPTNKRKSAKAFDRDL